jgi:GT2 family glycosyltransferase
MTHVRFSSVCAADFSVVICCFSDERWDDTLAAVASVQAQQPPPGEIVLVVDHNESLRARLASVLSDVIFVSNTEQQGLAGARNCGVAASSGKVIAFVDDDAVAEAGWLAALVDAYGDRVLGAAGSVLPRFDIPSPRWLPAEFHWVIGCSYTGLPTTPAPVRNFIGANMSLRREAFEHAGGFAHSLGRVGSHPAGCEETELCIRASRAFPGSTLIYTPAAAVVHRVTSGRATWAYFRRRCYAEGISKSIVRRLAGAEAALQTERAYVTRVLRRGAIEAVGHALKGDVATGVGRLFAIVTGLAFTVAGYVVGRWSG